MIPFHYFHCLFYIHDPKAIADDVTAGQMSADKK